MRKLLGLTTHAGAGNQLGGTAVTLPGHRLVVEVYGPGKVPERLVLPAYSLAGGGAAVGSAFESPAGKRLTRPNTTNIAALYANPAAAPANTQTPWSGAPRGGPDAATDQQKKTAYPGAATHPSADTSWPKPRNRFPSPPAPPASAGATAVLGSHAEHKEQSRLRSHESRLPHFEHNFATR